MAAEAEAELRRWATFELQVWDFTENFGLCSKHHVDSMHE